MSSSTKVFAVNSLVLLLLTDNYHKIFSEKWTLLPLDFVTFDKVTVEHAVRKPF